MSERTTTRPRLSPGGMRELAAMVRLDLRTIRAASVLVVLLVAGAALFIVFDPSAGIAPLTTIIAVVITVNLMTAHETHRLPLLYGALPVRRRTVITAHYLIAFAATLLATVPAVLGAAGITNEPFPDLWGIAGAAGVTLIIVSILLPTYVALGAQKGGFILIFSAFAIGAAGHLVQRNGTLPPSLVPLWVSTHFEALTLATGILLMPMSWALATGIYQRQDH